MLVGTKLFSLCLGDYWLIQIGCLSMFLALIGVAVAQSSLVIFIGEYGSFVQRGGQEAKMRIEKLNKWDWEGSTSPNDYFVYTVLNKWTVRDF